MQRDWLQLVSNAAIIVGLVVVIFEIRQSHTIAEAQLTNDDYISLRESLFALMGENAAAALAKAKSAPDTLTDAEKIVVDAHLRVTYTYLANYEFTADSTGFFDDWRSVVPAMFSRDFDFPYARDWWLRERALEKPWTSKLDEMLDEQFDIASE